MKIIATAHPNIGLIKYWGKRDNLQNLPTQGSIGVSLDKFKTTVTISGISTTKNDILVINDTLIEVPEKTRVWNYWQKLKKYIKLQKEQLEEKVQINISSNIPEAVGLASSSAVFAALAMAANGWYKLGYSRQEISILARLGSGSASRSIHGGFTEWLPGYGENSIDSFAIPLANELWWSAFSCLVIIFDYEPKTISSTEGMKISKETSPFYQTWLESISKDLMDVRTAINKRDFSLMRTAVERNTLKFQSILLSSEPPLWYWKSNTLSIIEYIRDYQKIDNNIGWTTDAGSNVILYGDINSLSKIETDFKKIPFIKETFLSKIGTASQFKEIG